MASAAAAANPYLLLAEDEEGGVRGRQLQGGRQLPLGQVAAASASATARQLGPGQLRAPADFSGAFTFRFV
jgi:beta-glucosidase-like glycosyl hydrolase